jgi:multiple sugar transport system permease protein
MAVTGQVQRSPARKRVQRPEWTGLLYIAPAMLLVIVFFVLPVIFTGWMSLHNWPLMGAQRWIGFNNYVRMFNDSRFMSALNFTAYYTVIVTIVIFAVAFPLALFVERERAFVSTYRTIIFLPVVVGLASASLLWVWLANVDSGFIGPALKALGLVDRAPNLLATFDSAFLTDHRHGRLEDRRLHHDHSDDRTAGHPADLRRRPSSTAQAGGSVFGTSPCR